MRSVLLFAIAAMLAIFLYKIVSLLSALAMVMLLTTGVAAYFYYRERTPDETIHTEHQGNSEQHSSGKDELTSVQDLHHHTAQPKRTGETPDSHELPLSLEMGNYQDPFSRQPSGKG